MPQTSALRVERHDGGVVSLTLALPDRRNAMTAELTAEWVEAVNALRGDRTVRCVVVTGQGQAFCAGGDVGWLAAEPGASPADLRDRMLPFYRAWLSLRALDVPSIAAVNGPAVGAGAALALSSATPGRPRASPSRSPTSAWRRGWPPPGCCPRWSAWLLPASCCSPGGWCTPRKCCG
jgi:enoyl-CoA hydratase/carnithine racemase